MFLQLHKQTTKYFFHTLSQKLSLAYNVIADYYALSNSLPMNILQRLKFFRSSYISYTQNLSSYVNLINVGKTYE
jgi:hypothetical protein